MVDRRTVLTRVRAIAPAVLALFLARSIVPHPVLVEHHHAGGELPHVHDGEVVPDEAEPHSHASDAPGIRAHGHPDGYHTHWQLPYQRAQRPADAALSPGTATVRLSPSRPLAPTPLAAVPPRSRGPPLSALG